MTNTINPFFTYDAYERAAATIQNQTKHEPKIGLILGSGLSPLADEIEQADYIPYADIPNFPVSGVEGHAGRLVIGKLAGKQVMVMQGRAHFYEGYSIQHITLPVRVMQILGISTLIVANAAGGIDTNFEAGDLMLITDHINLIGLGGNNPLSGPNVDRLGPRFPSLTHAYNPAIIALARTAAEESNLNLRAGVYACVAGPSFETPAEIRFLKAIGADAVGMSTAPEVVVANHAGMDVLGISTITNIAIQDTSSAAETSHEEVLEMGRVVVPKLITLLKAILAKIN